MVARIARAAIPKKSVLVLVQKKEFFFLICKYLSEYNVPHEHPLDLLPDRVEVAKYLSDWVANRNDNFLTRLVIERLMNKGIAKVKGAKKDKRSSPETIKNRIAEETRIAELWKLVDKKNSLFSVLCKNASSATVKIIGESLNGLLDAYQNFQKDGQGEFLKRLAMIAGIWCNPEEFGEDMSRVFNALNSQRPTGPGSVELKTMRKAKGLEADIVILVGLEDDIVPNQKNDPVEEARLFYVSMTRAKESLYLFHSFKRPRDISFGADLMKKQRSRFLDVIGRDSEYKRGQNKK
jgi:ATP-dependent exoDNAse (exonuclease V) beta subunit